MKSARKKQLTDAFQQNKLVISLGLTLLVALAASLFFVDWRSEVFADLAEREGDGFRVLVPSSWGQEQADSQTTFFSGDNVDTSDDAIIVGHSSQPIPGYESFDKEQKEEVINVLEALLNTYISSEGSESAAVYDRIVTEQSSHPQAELALDAEISGSDESGDAYRGKGQLLVTENGYFYFQLVGSREEIFEREIGAIQSVIDSFEITRI